MYFDDGCPGPTVATIHTLLCSKQRDLPIPVAFGKVANPVFNALQILTLSAASVHSFVNSNQKLCGF